MRTETTVNQTEAQPGLISFDKWLKGVGRSDVTGWRWVQKGWLQEPVNIAGKPYLTAENIAQFNRRAAAGEFAKKPHGAAAVATEARQSKLQTASA